MATTVDNRLNGPEDAAVTDSTLADSARAGTVTIEESPGGYTNPASYQDGTSQRPSGYLVHGLNMVQVISDYDRDRTARLQVPMPAAPWWIRFYLRLPADMQEQGHGIDEVRYTFACGDWALVLHETGSGNIGMRMQPTSGLQLDGVAPSAFTGSAMPIDRMLRIEIANDGTSTVVRAFDRHATTGERIGTWSSTAFNGSVGELTSYRYQRDHRLTYGNTTYSQDVADYQQWLIDLGYPAPNWGADGFYGDEHASQWDGFAGDRGFSELVGTFGSPDGYAGPEILAACDLAVRLELDNTGPWTPTYTNWLAVSDSGALGPADPPDESGSTALAASTSLTGAKVFTAAPDAGVLAAGSSQGAKTHTAAPEAGVAATAQASGHKVIQASASASAAVSVASAGDKEALAQPSAGVFVETAADGEDTTGGTAIAPVRASGVLGYQTARQDGPHATVTAASAVEAAKATASAGSTSATASTDVETASTRGGSGSAPITASTTASGFKQGTRESIALVQATGQSDGTSAPTGDVATTLTVNTGAEGAAGFQGAGTGGVLAGGFASGTKAVLDGSASTTVLAAAETQGTSETILPQVPIMGLLYRFVAYEPNGSRRGQLPMPLSFQLGVPHNDLPSLAFEYVRDAPGADLLESPAEVAVEFAPLGTDNYREYPGCRFLCLRSQSDYTDRAGVRRYTMPNYGWQLRKVRNLNVQASGADDTREFVSATPGEIFHTFLQEAQDRNNIPGLTWDFTPEADSDGNAWAHTLNVEYDLGQDLWSILQAMAKDGLVDWRFDKRVFQLYNTDTFLDRDRTSSVILHAGRDVTEAPDDSSYEDLAAYVLAKGVEGISYGEANPSALTPWGEWEDVISQNGVSDQGTLTNAVQARLSQTSAARTQMTRAIVFPTTLYLPFRDYRPGDTILLPGHRGEPGTEGRVRQITIKSVEPHSVEGNLVVNDRFIERDLRMDRTLSALTGNTSSVGGSGGSPGEDTRTPAAPEGLGLATDTYLNELGEPRGQITAGWSAVDTAENGTDMDVERYEVWLRHAVSGANWQVRTTVDAPDVTADMSPFDVGEVYEVAVRAIGRNNRRSAFSDVASVAVADDAIAPPVPSDPILSTRLGVIRAYWDGLTETGTDMPLDFDFVAVYMSETGAAETFERVETLYRSGSAIIPDQPYDEDRFFYFTALDRSGNESGPSATLSIATDQVVSTDVTPGSVGYELLAEGAVRDDILDDDAVRNRHIAAGEITGGKIRAYTIFADRLAIGTTQNLYYDNNYEDSDLSGIRLLNGFHGGPDWGTLLATGSAGAPADRKGARFVVSAASTTDGVHVSLMTGAVDPAADHDAFGAWPGDENAYSTGDAGVVTTSADIYTANMDAGVVLAANTLWHVRYLDGTDEWFSSGAQFVTVNGATTLSFQFDLDALGTEAAYYIPVWHIYPTGSSDPINNGGVVFLARARTVAATGSTVIADGAVTTDKVAANAITAGKIEAGSIDAAHIRADAIETSQLSADAITSKHTITGALIQTEITANRGIKLRSTGLFAYDSNGAQTVSLSASTGEISAVGRLQTGKNNEPRAILDPDVYGGRPGSRYDIFVNYELQPCIFGEGQNGSYNEGSLVLLSAEITTNDTGRETLSLRGQGGGFYLGREYGNAERCAINATSSTMDFYGRFPNNHTSDALFFAGIVTYSSAVAGGSTTWGIPSDSLVRPILTSYVGSGAVPVGLTSISNSGFSWDAYDGTVQTIYYFGFRGGVFAEET